MKREHKKDGYTEFIKRGHEKERIRGAHRKSA